MGWEEGTDQTDDEKQKRQVPKRRDLALQEPREVRGPGKCICTDTQLFGETKVDFREKLKV